MLSSRRHTRYIELINFGRFKLEPVGVHPERKVINSRRRTNLSTAEQWSACINHILACRQHKLRLCGSSTVAADQLCVAGTGLVQG
jgi:hypothetical protein